MFKTEKVVTDVEHRLSFKAVCQEMPEKNSGENKILVKKYNGENGLQRKAILCGVIPGKTKNISDRNTFYN